MSKNHKNETCPEDFIHYTVETTPQYTVVHVTIHDQKMFFIITPYDNTTNIIYQPTINQLDDLIEEIENNNINTTRFKHTFFDIDKTNMLLSLITNN